MPEHKQPPNQPPNQYEAAFLKRRYQPYGDNRKLAHHLGLSVTALDARARELGIPKRRRWTRTEKQRLRERLEEDHSYQQIAAQLRRSVTAVRVPACRLGLAVRADDPIGVALGIVDDDGDPGETWREVMALFGRMAVRVYHQTHAESGPASEC